MTREELRLNIELTLLAGLFEPKGTTDAILDLFDRFEEEKWSKPGEVPTGVSRLILVCDIRRSHVWERAFRADYKEEIADWKHWRFRELPKPLMEEQ